MRQILCNSTGALVARMPRPILEPGSVLVRVHYSLISAGTEVAALRPSTSSAEPAAPLVESATVITRLARTYLGRALRDPKKAARKVAAIARHTLQQAVARRSSTPASALVRERRDALEPQADAREREDQGWNVGYSAAGEVLAVGEGVTDLQPGDRVACAGAGRANHADYVCVPRNLACRVPKECSLKAAATATVGAIALQGVRRAAPQLGERVCVLGLGLIGQIVAQLLRAAGCTVIGHDLCADRLARARTLGMEAGTADAAALPQLVRDLTQGRGVDRTLIAAATRSDAVVNLAMDITRAKGTVVLVGDVGLNIQRAAFYRKEIDLLMSTSYGPGRYDPAYEEEGHDYPFAYVRWTLNRNLQAYLDLLAARRLDVEALIDQVVDVEQAPAVYRMLAEGKGNLPLGVLLHYPEDSDQKPEAADATRITLGGHPPVPDGRARYALVGAGAFGTCMLVAQMRKRADRFFLRGLVSRDTTRGGNFARAQGVEVFTTDYQAVLRDPGFDLVVLATRHHEHADQVVAALQAGKHVFVEKPLALTWDELHRVVTAYEKQERRPLLMVGFNRRFAPAWQPLLDCLRQRRAPLLVHYRVNGGYLPPDHWTQGPQGGGRNRGEACHMYDLFRFLAGAPVTRVAAQAIDPQALPYRRSDNFCATLSYADGSVGNLVYSALGPKQGMGKERIEIFCDGEAYVVDDFRKTTRASDGQVLWQSDAPDKGHYEELSRFGDALATGSAAPLSWDEIVETTAVTLHVEDLIHGRILDDES